MCCARSSTLWFGERRASCKEGQCGSCRTFRATGAVELQMVRKTGNVVPMSEQTILVGFTSPCGFKAVEPSMVAGWIMLTITINITETGVQRSPILLKQRMQPCKSELSLLWLTHHIYGHCSAGEALHEGGDCGAHLCWN